MPYADAIFENPQKRLLRPLSHVKTPRSRRGSKDAVSGLLTAFFIMPPRQDDASKKQKISKKRAFAQHMASLTDARPRGGALGLMIDDSRLMIGKTEAGGVWIYHL